jgi:hypothetical protein
MGLKQGVANKIESVAKGTPEVVQAMALLVQNDLNSFEICLSSYFAQHGAWMFTRNLAFPLIDAVGNLWQQRRLPVYAEHLFFGMLQKVTLQSSLCLAPSQPSTPRVLLASPAAEVHTLALVLLNAVLHEAGISTVFLQGGLPACEIAAAAAAFKVQVVALSASVVCPPKLLTTELHNLRGLLDTRAELWIGGAGTHRISTRISGVTVMTSIDAAVQTLKSKFGRDPKLVGTVKDKNHD